MKNFTSIIKNNKIIALVLIIVLLIIVLVCVGMFVSQSNTIVVAYYRLDKKTHRAIEKHITSLWDNENNKKTDKKLRFIVLDNNSPLARQAKQIDILFAPAGENTSALAPKATAPSGTFLRRMPMSVGEVSMYGQKAPYSLPIVLDHFEVAYNTEMLATSLKNNAPPSLAGLEKFAYSAKGQSKYPILCSGGIDRELLLFVGSLVESCVGEEGWKKLVSLISSKTDFTDLKQTPLVADGPSLEQILTIPMQWQKDGLMHPEWFNTKQADTSMFMEFYNPAVVFMSLSLHRAIPVKIVRPFTASWFPQNSALHKRSLTVPTTCAFVLTKKSSEIKEILKNLLDSLSSEHIQAQLSTDSELAPVNSIAQAQDRQASDVRLWAASADSLLPSLEESFATQSEIAAFAKEIRRVLAGF